MSIGAVGGEHSLEGEDEEAVQRVMTMAAACSWGHPCHKYPCKPRALGLPTVTSAGGATAPPSTDEGCRGSGKPRKVAQLRSGRVTFEPGPSGTPTVVQI